MLKNTLKKAIIALCEVFRSGLATHVIYKEVRYHHILENLLAVDKGIKLVLLVRNPVEVMSSWINAPKEFDVKWNADEQLINTKLKNIGRKKTFMG